MRSSLRPAGGLLLAAALLTACGSSSSSTAAAGQTGASSPAAAASSAPAATTAAAPAGGGDFCAVVRKNLKLVTGTEMSSLLAGGKPAAWKAYLAAAAKANGQLVDAAPAAIRPALETLRKDSDSVGTLMASAGYDLSKVDSSKLLKSVTSPEHQAASKTFVTYVKGSCGVDLSKPVA